MPEPQKMDNLHSDDIVLAEPSTIHQALRFLHYIGNQNLSLEDQTRVKSTLTTSIERLEESPKLQTREIEALRAHNCRNYKNSEGNKKNSGPSILSVGMSQRAIEIKS
ncbi:hypothetical protein GcM3_179029 [Golovinomyces cichoracearum]|uniref:Uncharacterized protein n=1 Tax=Golovinomyces cichoracearum TaxID=62708 RepID=A0A420HN37_9PEZI|nr:hypothetical protein GcM3_179029 [Golovinomyces cichoracearum]